MPQNFSIETKSRKHIKSVILKNSDYEPVLIEGDLGDIDSLSLIEGRALEVVGSNGVLRIELDEKQLRELFKKGLGSTSSEVGSYRNTK
jgi:hypothetical protein